MVAWEPTGVKSASKQVLIKCIWKMLSKNFSDGLFTSVKRYLVERTYSTREILDVPEGKYMSSCTIKLE